VIVSVRSGTEPVASMALRRATMPDSVLQVVANLVAIGLERARAQDLAQEVEAARQSEQLRTTLIDAVAHEFKKPLTLIKAATTSLLAMSILFCQSALPAMAFDKRLMKLDTRQLLDNALKYASAETAIEIGAQVADGLLSVELTDYGKGIPAEEQLRIFDGFYRSP